MTFVRPRTLVARLAAAMMLSVAALQVAHAQDSTAALHYKGLTLQPIGYAAFESVWRQRNITADIGSSYSAIPFSGTTNGNLTEFRLSGRQSRIGLLATGNVGSAKGTAYWESDFLSSGISSNSNESNSYSLRIRQFFAQAAFTNGWTISGGQMWSMMTPDKSSAGNPRTEAVPLTIEAQYAVGFNWARQAGLRFVQKVDDVTSWGFGVEESQTSFSGRNLPANFVTGQLGGSLLNSTTNYSTDYSPDFVAKLAFDPKGMGHWELKGVASSFRDRIIDPATATTSRNSTTWGYGVGFGVYIPVIGGGRDVMDFGLSGLYGNGIGRYGTTMLPDVTIAADSTLKTITASQIMLSLETHPTKDLDVYSYIGAEYADRTTFVNAAGKGAGYGSPLNSNAACQTELAPTNQNTPNGGACDADTRAFWQANIGFWYRFYKGAAGTVQWGMQYSYTSKNTWSDAAGIQPQAIDNMFFTSFRYVLP